MQYYAVLFTATAIIAGLGLAVYRRSRDLGTVVGFAALYYWSLYGAWSVVIDKTGGISGKHYHYLETKLFPVALDEHYLLALCLYAGFVIAIQLTMLLLLAPAREPRLPRLRLRHGPVLLIGMAAGVGSYLLMRDSLDTAWSLHTSAYRYTRSEAGNWFTLHQVLNRVAMLPPAIGLATLLAGGRSRFFVNIGGRYTLAGYAVLLGGMAVFTFLLGNKNEVLTALLTGMLAYVASVRRPNWVRLAAAGMGGVWFLYAIDYFRAYALSDLPRALSENLSGATAVGQFVSSSNEAFGAHFSMYGVLAGNVEPRFGYSIYSLVCSVIPRALWPGRPADIYLYYSESVGAIQNQGYSLHHATGWYLNFGLLGVLLGAVVLGLVWTLCLRARHRIRRRSGLAVRVMAVMMPWLFVACLPPLVRAGPEGYKGLVVDGVLIPLVVLMVACRPWGAKGRAMGPQWVLPPTGHPAMEQLALRIQALPGAGRLDGLPTVR